MAGASNARTNKKKSKTGRKVANDPGHHDVDKPVLLADPSFEEWMMIIVALSFESRKTENGRPRSFYAHALRSPFTSVSQVLIKDLHFFTVEYSILGSWTFNARRPFSLQERALVHRALLLRLP